MMDLKLWHVNLPVDDLPSICPNNDPERNQTLLSDLFQPVLDAKMIHVVVDVHTSRHIAEERNSVAALDRSACFLLFLTVPDKWPSVFEKTVNDIANALSPSDSAKSSVYPRSQLDYSIHDGRYKDNNPRSSIGPPIELLNPVFGHFLDDIRCTSGHIPVETIRWTAKYMQATSGHYTHERSRRDTLVPILSGVIGFNIQVVENPDRTKANGIVEGYTQDRLQHSVFLCMLKEDKKEFGDGGSDPSTQAGLSAARAWVQPRVRDFCFLFFRKAHSLIP